MAERHHQARVSRGLLALAIAVLIAVLATRAAAAAPLPAPTPQPAPVVIVPSDCDGEIDCGDGGDGGVDDDGGVGGDPGVGGEGDRGDEPSRVGPVPGVTADPAGVIPRIVSRGSTSHGTAGGARSCACATPPITLADVAAAALRAAGLAHDPAPSWNARTRLAGLVPMFSARYGRNLTWKDVDDPTLGYTNMYDLRATWHLERLLFDPNEIRIAALDVSRRREKRRVEMLAVHTYLAWLQLPRASPRAVLLAADLDAITDGWFSQALAKRGKP